MKLVILKIKWAKLPKYKAQPLPTVKYKYFVVQTDLRVGRL